MPPCEEGDGGKQRAIGGGGERATRIKEEARSIARSLCVGCRVSHCCKTTHYTSPQLNCTPSLHPALSHHHNRPFYAQRMDQPGGKMRRGRRGLDWTGLYAGGNAMSHLREQAHSFPCPTPPPFQTSTLWKFLVADGAFYVQQPLVLVGFVCLFFVLILSISLSLFPSSFAAPLFS